MLLLKGTLEVRVALNSLQTAKKVIFLDRHLILHIDTDVGFLLTPWSLDWCHFTGCKSEAMTLSHQFYIKNTIWFSHLKLQSIQRPTCSQLLQAVKVLDVEQTSCRNAVCVKTTEKNNPTTSFSETLPQATWQATPCHDLRSEATPTSCRKRFVVAPSQRLIYTITTSRVQAQYESCFH